MPWIDKDTYQFPAAVEYALLLLLIVPVIILWIGFLLAGPLAPVGLIIYLIGLYIS